MRLTFFISIISTALLFSCSKPKEGSNPVRDTSRAIVSPDTTRPATQPDSSKPAVKRDTLDAGWSKITIDRQHFADIFFNNNQTGYLTGNKIYLSTDGGKTWNIKFDNEGFNDIFVTDNGKAYFVNIKSGLWHFNPGDDKLTKSINEPFKNSITTDLFFVDDNVGYYIGANGLYKTKDGGSNWNVIYSKAVTSRFNYLYFTNETTGWFFLGKQLYKTNGSSSFDPIYTANTQLTCIKALSGTVLYLGDDQGQIFKSTDAGASFTLLSKLSTKGFTDLQFLTNTLAYASTGNSIYKTTDGGSTWNKVVVLQETEFVEIHFTDANHGWACGSNGTVLVFKAD